MNDDAHFTADDERSVPQQRELDMQRARTDELREQLRLARAESRQRRREGALAHLIKGLAHELNNPLTAILGHAQHLERAARDEKTLKRASVILQEVERCIRLIENLRSYALPPNEAAVASRVGKVLSVACDLVMTHGQMDIDASPAAQEATVRAAPSTLAEVLAQVLDNALQAGASTVRIDCEMDKHRVHIHCDNDGATPGEAVLERAAEPFFTTYDDDGDRRGLGLSMATSMLQEMQGGIRLQLRPDGQPGARCTISLPADTRGQSSSRRQALRPFGELVLVIDDEPLVAELLHGLLSEAGWAARCCGSRAEALQLLARERVVAVLVDRRLPDADGVDLLTEILALQPHLHGHAALVTADKDEDPVLHASRDLDCALLGKPFHLDEAQEILARIL